MTEQAAISHSLNAELIGTTQEVLIEEKRTTRITVYRRCRKPPKLTALPMSKNTGTPNRLFNKM